MIEKGTAVGCPFEIVKKACHCEADSPCQGEMSRRDKRDREAQRADAAYPLQVLRRRRAAEDSGPYG